MANDLFYRVVRSGSRNSVNGTTYHHLTMEIWEYTSYSQGLTHNAGFVVKWQAGHDTRQDNWEQHEWYGHEIAIEKSHAQDILNCIKVIRRVFSPAFAKAYNSDPLDLLDRLDKLGATYMVYDPRLIDFVTLDDLMPKEYLRYMDNLRTDQAYVSCLARNESEAKDKMLVKFAQQGYKDAVVTFIEADMPVRQAYYCDPPKFYCSPQDIVSFTE